MQEDFDLGYRAPQIRPSTQEHFSSPRVKMPGVHVPNTSELNLTSPSGLANFEDVVPARVSRTTAIRNAFKGIPQKLRKILPRRAATERTPLLHNNFFGIDSDDEETSFGGPPVLHGPGSMPRAQYIKFANMGGMKYPNLREAFGKPFKRSARVTPAESMPLLPGEPELPIAPRRSLGAFLNTHKRKLIVGGVIGGAAIAGTVGGILSSKRRKTMQSNESAGLFERLSAGPVSRSGGGGGGGSIGGGHGFARYNQIQSAVRRYRRSGGKRKGGKRKSQKSRKSRKSRKSNKKGVRN